MEETLTYDHAPRQVRVWRTVAAAMFLARFLLNFLTSPLLRNILYMGPSGYNITYLTSSLLSIGAWCILGYCASNKLIRVATIGLAVMVLLFSFVFRNIPIYILTLIPSLLSIYLFSLLFRDINRKSKIYIWANLLAAIECFYLAYNHLWGLSISMGEIYPFETFSDFFHGWDCLNYINFLGIFSTIALWKICRSELFAGYDDSKIELTAACFSPLNRYMAAAVIIPSIATAAFYGLHLLNGPLNDVMYFLYKVF